MNSLLSSPSFQTYVPPMIDVAVHGPAQQQQPDDLVILMMVPVPRGHPLMAHNPALVAVVDYQQQVVDEVAGKRVSKCYITSVKSNQ